jgi:hypothetical protein
MGLGASQDGYQGGLGVIDFLPGGDGEKFVKVYNDTGAAVTNGDLFFLSYAKDADTLSPSARPTLDACATSAVYRHIVVINNAPLRGATIADAAWGYAQVMGYCPKVACAATISIDDFLGGSNSTPAIAADDGTTIANTSFGIAVTAYSAGFCTAILFGERVTI